MEQMHSTLNYLIKTSMTENNKEWDIKSRKLNKEMEKETRRKHQESKRKNPVRIRKTQEKIGR